MHHHKALITGASRGIGLELARLHAQAGHDLLLIARSDADLHTIQKNLSDTYHVTVHIFAVDLATPESATQVYEYCQTHHFMPDYLINNAGFGGYGEFRQQDRTHHQSMMQLNMATLTHLTYLFVPGMIERKSGRILQVGSTAGMLPGPMQAVYHATKAYVLSLSQAIAKELEGTGVTMTVLCPGPVETGFAKAADVADTAIFQHPAKADLVAREGYDAMMRGDLVVMSGLPRYVRILMGLMPLLPRSFVLHQAKQAIQKVK